MKNIVFIVVDSVFEEIIHNNSDICPFLSTIKGESICFSNVYSQGPYTEAGTKGLLCSENTLDHDAYLFRYSKADNFISIIFKELGFTTSSVIYPTTLYNPRIVKSLDSIVLTSVFLPTVFWYQKLLFYKPIWNNGVATKRDYDRVFSLLNDIFYFWQYSLEYDNRDTQILFSKYDGEYPYKEILDFVNVEKEKFEHNPIGYIDDLFATDGAAFKIDTFSSTNVIKHKSVQAAIRQNKHICRKLVLKQLAIELRKISLLFATCKNNVYAERHNLCKNWIKGVARSFDINVAKGNTSYKLLLSAKSQLDYVGDYLINHRDKPQFIMAHVEEPHYYNTFFSYDNDKIDEISAEFKYAGKYVDKIKPSTYTGSIYYDLSIRYVDLQIKRLFEKMDSAGILKDTIVVLTSDHGSSFTGRFIRPSEVVNFFNENYHIPFMIYDKGICGKEITKLASNIDIIPTLLDYMKLKIPDTVAGHSILSSYNRNSVFIEHVGSGCPDINYKPVWIAVRNSNYLISYIGMAHENYNYESIEAVYDIKKDPNQYVNIKKTVKSEDIADLINSLQERIKSLNDAYKRTLVQNNI